MKYFIIFLIVCSLLSKGEVEQLEVVNKKWARVVMKAASSDTSVFIFSFLYEFPFRTKKLIALHYRKLSGLTSEA